MGVMFLQTYLKDKEKENHGSLVRICHCAPHGGSDDVRNILVDDMGFVISLSGEVQKRFAAWSVNAYGLDAYTDADVVGGDLQPLRDALAYIITRLRAVYGIELVVCCDAPRGLHADPSERDAVWDQRAAQGLVSQDAHVEYCRGASNEKSKNSSSPGTPAHLRSLMLETFTQFGVAVRRLDDEVDCHIGALFDEFKPLCLFSGDTDFVVTDDIPVVMDLDFPWDAMLFGWTPFAPATPRNDAPIDEPSLLLKIVDAAALRSHLHLIAPDELYFAASLCGNDVVPLEVARSLRVRDDKYYTMAHAAQQVRHSRTRWDLSAVAEDLSNVTSEILRTSITKYREAAQQRPRAARLEPGQKRLHDQLVKDDLSPTYVATIRSHQCKDGAPSFLFNNTYSHLHDLFTFRLLRHAEFYMLGHTSLQVTRSTPDETIDEAISFPPDTLVLWDSEEYRRARLPQEKVLALVHVFTMTPDSCFALLQCDRGAPLLPPRSVLLPLWVMHSGCTIEDIRLIATMIVLVHAAEFASPQPSQHALAARAVIRGLPHIPRHEGDAAAVANVTRPSVRTLELSRLFTTACGSTAALLKLLGVRADVNFPAMADMFSGTLLHALCFLSPVTQQQLCRAALRGKQPCDATRTVSVVAKTVNQLCKDFTAGFKDIHFLDEPIDLRGPAAFGTHALWFLNHSPICCFHFRNPPACTREKCKSTHVVGRHDPLRACSKGDQCPVGHGRAPVLCCHNLQNKCNRPHCQYAHEDSWPQDGSRRCSFGDKCGIHRMQSQR